MDFETLTEDTEYIEQHQVEENVEIYDNMTSMLDMDITEHLDIENAALGDTEVVENIPATLTEATVASPKKPNKVADKKPPRLPLARVKTLMKMDPECQLISQDAAFLVTRGTEMFITYLGQQAANHTLRTKRRTILKQDVDAAIDNIPQLCFLDGALE